MTKEILWHYAHNQASQKKEKIMQARYIVIARYPHTDTLGGPLSDDGIIQTTNLAENLLPYVEGKRTGIYYSQESHGQAAAHLLASYVDTLDEPIANNHLGSASGAMVPDTLEHVRQLIKKSNYQVVILLTYATQSRMIPADLLKAYAFPEGSIDPIAMGEAVVLDLQDKTVEYLCD